MPVNNFSIGRDIAIDVVGAQGPVRLNLITGFAAKPTTIELKVKPLSGPPIFSMIPDGHTGSFELERVDPTIDRYFSQLENNFYSGLNTQSITMTETITEPNGAISQFRYTGVQLKYDDAGSWKQDTTVKQKLSFVASRKYQVA
jgi:hypothetical protein